MVRGIPGCGERAGTKVIAAWVGMGRGPFRLFFFNGIKRFTLDRNKGVWIYSGPEFISGDGVYAKPRASGAFHFFFIPVGLVRPVPRGTWGCFRQYQKGYVMLWFKTSLAQGQFGPNLGRGRLDYLERQVCS